jgi:hypothetical protein
MLLSMMFGYGELTTAKVELSKAKQIQLKLDFK